MIAYRKQADKIDKTQGYETVDQTNKLSDTKKTSGYKPLYFQGDILCKMLCKRMAFFIIK